ncbi:HEPN domain-containing protein [Candidatus Woesearchaeota archaeon]|nr:HEPN domain-containing protein [Candidatus Woesearchaeota archaeon]
MSQVSNKVKWCLNKAERELEETGLHRGLVKSEPNMDFAEKHMVKAEHNLNAALYFEKGGYSDWSTSAFFYCLYHCFLAILRKYGYESRNQECTLAVIEALKEEGVIDIDSKFIDTLKITKVKETDHSVIKMREDFQYGVELDFKRKDEFDELTKMCKEFIYAAREIIHSQ